MRYSTDPMLLAEIVQRDGSRDVDKDRPIVFVQERERLH